MSYDELDEYNDNEFCEEFANRMGVDSYSLQKFIQNKTLADSIKFESFINNCPNFTIEQFDINTITK